MIEGADALFQGGHDALHDIVILLTGLSAGFLARLVKDSLLGVGHGLVAGLVDDGGGEGKGVVVHEDIGGLLIELVRSVHVQLLLHHVADAGGKGGVDLAHVNVDGVRAQGGEGVDEQGHFGNAELLARQVVDALHLRGGEQGAPGGVVHIRAAEVGLVNDILLDGLAQFAVPHRVAVVLALVAVEPGDGAERGRGTLQGADGGEDHINGPRLDGLDGVGESAQLGVGVDVGGDIAVGELAELVGQLVGHDAVDGVVRRACGKGQGDGGAVDVRAAGGAGIAGAGGSAGAAAGGARGAGPDP